MRPKSFRRLFFPPSIRRRFFIACLVLLPVFLGTLGFMLDTIHKQSLVRSVVKNLELHLTTMVAEAEPVATDMVINGRRKVQASMPETLIDADLNSPESNLQGFIRDGISGEILWRSPSSALYDLYQHLPEFDDFKAGKTQVSEFTAPDGKQFFISTLATLFSLEGEDVQWFFIAALDQADFKAEILHYRKSLALSLLITGTVLTLSLILTITWGIIPLNQLADDIQKLEHGEMNHLSGDYPKELQNLAHNLNQLIQSETRQRERYRNTLGDLAHSLKTPLAVCRGLLNELNGLSDSKDQLGEQLERMNQIVQYQLQRATSVQPALHQQNTPVKKNVERILNALGKVYFDKHMQTEVNISDNDSIWMDERDLTEVLGNVLDNAFKYGQSKVAVRTQICLTDDNKKQWKLIVENDGTPVPEEKRKTILQRGARLDTAESGQGIGLAVVTDIISNYGGSVEIDSSNLGGASFIMQISQP